MRLSRITHDVLPPKSRQQPAHRLHIAVPVKLGSSIDRGSSRVFVHEVLYLGYLIHVLEIWGVIPNPLLHKPLHEDLCGLERFEATESVVMIFKICWNSIVDIRAEWNVVFPVIGGVFTDDGWVRCSLNIFTG